MEERKSFLESRPILEHLDELLKRARRVFIWIVLGACVGYYFSSDAVRLMSAPLLVRLPPGAHLIFTAPFEKMWTYFRVALIGGVALVSPFICREIAAFVSPGLKESERRRIFYFVSSVCVAFILGIVLGYRFVLPAVLDALLKFGASTELPMLTISRYINAALGILLLSAVFMEIPVVMFHTTLSGWVRVKTWSKGRRHSIVVNSIISALLSPPDALSMLVMMVPLQILYEGGILGSRVAQWLHERSKKTTSPSDVLKGTAP